MLIEIPYESLEKETLIALIESFVLREGTDYGENEATLDKKVNDIFLQVQSGELKILYDDKEESCNFVHKRELTKYLVSK